MKIKSCRFLFLLTLVCLLVVLPIHAEETTGRLPRLLDASDLLTDSEESNLLSILDEISERQQFDLVIVTTDTTEGETVADYADDVYDYYGYGMGADRSGVLLLVSMAQRDLYLSTCGYGITAFTDYGIDLLLDEIAPYLSNGNYYNAFYKFCQYSDQYITLARQGNPVDGPNGTDRGFDPAVLPFLAVIAVIVGLLIGLIPIGVLKSQMKTVVPEQRADQYVDMNSLNLTRQADAFLYANTSRIRRSSGTTGRGGGHGGGSSVHISHSGMSHGGGGRKF